jgi:hypothetical protein
MSCWEVKHVRAIGPIGWNMPVCRIELSSGGAYSTISSSHSKRWSMVSESESALCLSFKPI